MNVELSMAVVVGHAYARLLRVTARLMRGRRILVSTRGKACPVLT